MTLTSPSSRMAHKSDSRESLRLAAIDVGSNSIHMIVAQADADGGITTLWRLKEPVGLGRLSFPSRRLTADAMSRAITVLERFQKAAQQRQAEKIVAVATKWPQTCPVSGEKIASLKDAVGSDVYKGKTYYFCCPMCKPLFVKDPAKYIAAAKKGKYLDPM